MAPTSTDPWAVLGLPRDFTDEQLHQAWVRAAHEHHPDRRGGSRERFEEARAAYECLRDPERRRQLNEGTFDFDRFLEEISQRVSDSIPDLKELREQLQTMRSSDDKLDRVGAGARLLLHGITVYRRIRGRSSS